MRSTDSATRERSGRVSSRLRSGALDGAATSVIAPGSRARIDTRSILGGIGSHMTAGYGSARVGSTAASTGCHLHNDVRLSGTRIDRVPWMRQRGVPIG